MTPLAREVLALLPTEPDGLSLAALAEELLGKRDPASRSVIALGLWEIAEVIGELHVGRGDDEEWGRYNVKVYGLRRAQLAAARAVLSRAGGAKAKS
jgi:hypothetical protein